MLKVIMVTALCVIAFAVWNEYAPCALVPWNHERFICEVERWDQAYRKAHHGKGPPNALVEFQKLLEKQRKQKSTLDADTNSPEREEPEDRESK
jgi:hypothetical protein